MERLTLIGVDWDGMVHVLHSLFSVPVGRYYTERKLLAFSGELPTEGIPSVTDLSVDSFRVRRAVCAVPREDHLVHVEDTPP